MPWHNLDHADDDLLARLELLAAGQHHIVNLITNLITELSRAMSDTQAGQAHLDADVQAILAEIVLLDTTDQAIAAEIAALKAAYPAVDFTGLDTAAAGLTSSVANLGDLVPAPDVPPATPPA